MGRFFREFSDAPNSSSSSLTVLLMGIVMFGGMAWLVNLVINGSPSDSIMQLVAYVQELMARPEAGGGAVQ